LHYHHQKVWIIFSLRSISIYQFKNYSNSSFEFNERIVGICGKNGIGKTNLIDAIYNLCFTRSYFNRSDIQNVQHQKNGFRIEGEFEKNSQLNTVVSVLRENGKKEFSVDGQAYDRFARHIGLLPAVIIVPDDVVLISGASDERRRFMDTLFCQLDAGYMQHLIAYNKVLLQRNSYLKSFPDKRPDQELIDTYDEQLVQHGSAIHDSRQRMLEQMIPMINNFYEMIAGKDENISPGYESQLSNNRFSELLLRNRERDIFLQRTTTGIHRDDLIFTIDSRSFKTEASQGQRKSLLFALKLAEFETLRLQKGFAPILLLDDVFEKLDEDRIRNLLEWVCRQNSGQIFITDTHADRFRENVEHLGIKYQLLDI